MNSNSIFVKSVVAPYNDDPAQEALRANAPRWEETRAIPFSGDKSDSLRWRCAISRAIGCPADAEDSDDVSFCTAMDNSFILPSYNETHQAHVAICEAACIFGIPMTYSTADAPALCPTGMSAFVYALSARLLDGHFDRLEQRRDSWFTDELCTLVTEILERFYALWDRAQTATSAERMFYRSQVPRVVLALDPTTKTCAELQPWAVYALSSIMLSCPRLHMWTSLADVPPCMLAAYTCLPRTILSTLFGDNRVVAEATNAVVSTSLTRRRANPGIYLEPSAMAFLHIYGKVLMSAVIDHTSDCTALIARWMLWKTPEMVPLLRHYLGSNEVQVINPRYGLPSVTRLAGVVDAALFYAITRAADFAVEPSLRELWGEQLHSLLLLIKPHFPLSVAMLLTCSPVPVPSSKSARHTGIPDVSMSGVRARTVRVGMTDIHPRVVDKATGAGSYSPVEMDWFGGVTNVPGNALVATFATDVDYNKEVANLVHCMRLQGAAFAGHTEWCRSHHMLQSYRAVTMDVEAMRVFTLMRLRLTVLSRADKESATAISFACLSPIVYRELCSLPHIQLPAIRAELASVLSSLITTMMLPRRTSIDWTAVRPAAVHLGFTVPLAVGGHPTISSAEAILLGPFNSLLGRVVPWIADNAHVGSNVQSASSGIVSTATTLLARDAESGLSLRLPQKLWTSVLRVFFVMNKHRNDGRYHELPQIIAVNPGCVQALAFMYMFMTMSHCDIVDAYENSDHPLEKEPDLMGVDEPPELVGQRPPAAAGLDRKGAPRSAKQTTVYANRLMNYLLHHKPACMEDFVAQRDDLQSLSDELDALVACDDEYRPANLHAVTSATKHTSRMIRRAACQVFSTNKSVADLGTALSELGGTKRADPNDPKRKRSRRKLDSDEQQQDDGDGSIDYNDDGDAEHAGTGEDLAIVSTKMALFALIALLMAADEDPAVYARVAAKVVVGSDVSIHSHKTFHNTGGVYKGPNTLDSISATIAAVRTNRDKQPLTGVYQQGWFPQKDTPESQTGDTIISSLFLLELTPMASPVNAFRFYRELSNNLPAAHRFREYADFDLPYADAINRGEFREPILHYAHSLTHGVRDNHVAGIASPPLGPLNVASPTKVPYRMSTARWAAQMHIDSPLQSSDIVLNKTTAVFAASLL